MKQKRWKTDGYLRIFASYYRPHWKLFALDMVCALCICLVDLAFPIVSRFSMQTLLPGQMFTAFFVVMAVLAGAYVLKGCFYYIITYWGHLLGVRMEADIRRDLFSHMQDLSFSFYDKNRTGQLMSRVTGDPCLRSPSWPTTARRICSSPPSPSWGPSASCSPSGGSWP